MVRATHEGAATDGDARGAATEGDTEGVDAEEEEKGMMGNDGRRSVAHAEYGPKNEGRARRKSEAEEESCDPIPDGMQIKWKTESGEKREQW